MRSVQLSPLPSAAAIASAGWLLSLGTLTTAGTGGHGQGEPLKPLAVDVALSQGSTDAPQLDVCLRNNGTAPVEVTWSTLPWGSRYSMFLVAAPRREAGSKVLHSPGAFEEPGFGPDQTIQPKRQLCGSIRLARRFPDLARTLQTGEVLLFWEYQSPIPPKHSFSGYFVLKPSRERK